MSFLYGTTIQQFFLPHKELPHGIVELQTLYRLPLASKNKTIFVTQHKQQQCTKKRPGNLCSLLLKFISFKLHQMVQYNHDHSDNILKYRIRRDFHYIKIYCKTGQDHSLGWFLINRNQRHPSSEPMMHTPPISVGHV